MLEMGKRGSAGEEGEVPVLRDLGDVVAVLRPSPRERTVEVRISDGEWLFARSGRELSARRAADPEGTTRSRAYRTSMWKGTWSVDLEGTGLEGRITTGWSGGHRYLDPTGRIAARSGTTGGWSPRRTLTADPSLPLDVQVFLLWVEAVAGLPGGDGVVFADGDGSSDGGGDGGGGGD